MLLQIDFFVNFFIKVLFQLFYYLYCVLLCQDCHIIVSYLYNLRFKTGIMLFFEISIFASDVFVSENCPKGHGI